MMYKKLSFQCRRRRYRRRRWAPLFLFLKPFHKRHLDLIPLLLLPR